MNTETEQLEHTATSQGLAETARMKVVVADGSEQFMAVVLALLDLHESVDLIGRAANFDETLRLVVNHQPEIVVIDLQIPFSNLVIPAITLSTQSPVKVIGLFAGKTLPLSVRSVLASVDALIHKSCLKEQLSQLLETIVVGGRCPIAAQPSHYERSEQSTAASAPHIAGSNEPLRYVRGERFYSPKQLY